MILKKKSTRLFIIVGSAGLVWGAAQYLHFDAPMSSGSDDHSVSENTTVDQVTGSTVEQSFVHPYDDDFVMKFPDGTAVRYSLLPYPSFPQWPDGRISDSYDVLRASAENGNVSAAYTLNQMLSYCSQAIRDKQVLDDAINELHQTGRMTADASDGQIIFSTNMNPESFAREMTKRYERCSGVSDNQIEEASAWLHKAADGGNPHAQLAVGQQLLRAGDVEAERYLLAAWHSGNVVAASHLWYYYTRNPDVERNDPVTGFAYEYLHRRIMSSYSEFIGNSQSVAAPFVESNSRFLTSAGYELSPHQSDQAIQLAQTLLTDNANCCFSPLVRDVEKYK